MTPISVAVQRAMREIPREILQQAFNAKRYDPTRQDRYFDNVDSISLDEKIRELVIDGRVAIDCNLVGGTEILLPMRDADREYIDSWNIIYRFPPHALGNRKISTVHELIYGLTQGLAGSTATGFDSRNSGILKDVRNIIRATNGVAMMGTAYVQLLNHNTVLVNDSNQVMGDAALRCTVSHEPNFNDIKQPYYRDFGEMVVLAVKAHVYNTLVIDLDEGFIRGGATLGRVREIIDGYADANTMYNEFVDVKWAKLAILMDPDKYRKVMKMSMGGKPRL